ncbi:MAG TPA: hypothetical protein VGP63_05690 [Planctomycetaceae bacterium]|nr:hypothetical protein [Planctomycetaceae bacterium]
MNPRPTSRLRLAAVVTEYRKFSHAEHIVDRFLYGYGWEGRHHKPDMDVLSLYVDQRPAGDLSRARAAEFPKLRVVPTIADALTDGGRTLSVDGVLLIGEHGNYPRNEKGQTLYPRYEFFAQIIDVFRKSGQSVPIFNDKHLSWSWDRAQEMVATSRALGFPLMAGSSLPVTRRLPAIDFPYRAEATEVMAIGYGNVDSYDFHVLETIQCMAERRRGGETGVAAVQAIRGDDVWTRMNAGSWQAGGWDPELFKACVCRSISLGSARAGYSDAYPSDADVRKLVKTPVAYRIEYRDGLKATMLLLNGLVTDMTFAARLKGSHDALSCLMYLPHRDVCNFFNPLAHQAETMFLTGKSPRPIERTLLTTGLTAAGIESLWRGQQRIETPHLAVGYQVGEESTFWRT